MKRWLLAAAFALPIHPQVIPGSPFTGGGGGGATSFPLLAPVGAVGAPSYSFAGQATTGIWYNTGWIDFTAGGVDKLAITPTSTQIPSGSTYDWSASTVGAGSDTGLARFSAGVVRITNGSTVIRGLLGGGAAVASASALPLPTGNVFHVTGVTNITSITSTNFASGACIMIIFDGVLTLTDGNNIVAAGNFVTTADDTWSACYDGTNWYESARAVN